MHDRPVSCRARRILIVDDEFLIAWDLEHTLTAAGLTVVGIAATAECAVHAAERHRPDLVVMDVRLAGSQDGIDAAVEIWRRFHIRSLFITGNPEDTRSRRAEAANAVGVIAKPYRDDEVVGTLCEALP